ncbi:hypothetical protein PILCRDRAFT_820624 [Piloderma croceum F 1598]|uniref:Uncharacterized protein n=1 Tax=Piloderma croceum (strain F 1598) TaxID=765440 RepID=A0A0C3FRB0_PILCF|nr:hypothetical protein PILCRDRAFT_830459 [Piloderma croceum F 1598]KIM82239.1 hypothetical protein PILCRDRAFT_820624 [Piloderma croceum F 1598]
MHIALHFASYVAPVASLVVGLAPALIPTKIKEAPIALAAIFSVFVARFEPAPNHDNLFTLFQCAIWALACCQLVSYPFNDVIVNFDWMIALLALLPALFLIGAIFRRIVGHCAKDLGVFGIIILCCCDVAKVVHGGLMSCLSRCSGSDASDDDAEASSLPSYTASCANKISIHDFRNLDNGV